MKYEFPLNEKIRTMLRLEDLFNKWHFFYAQESAYNHHNAISILFEISEIASRLDFKIDISNELDRQNQVLSQLRDSPDIDSSALEELLDSLNRATNDIGQLFSTGILTSIDKEWLYSIKNRINIAGGTCQFDLPSYYNWQQKSVSDRQSDLSNWISPLLTLENTIKLILNLLRESSNTIVQEATKGVYQKMLSGKVYQLLQLELSDSRIIPEVSGNKYMITVKFNYCDNRKNLLQVTDNVPFTLTLCNF